MIPKKVKAPDGCASYLTPGKEYNVITAHAFDPKRGYYLTIECDLSTTINTFEKHTRHLNGQDWIVTEWE